jgi:hypothetical protein
MKNICHQKIPLAIIVGLAIFAVLAANGCGASQKVKNMSGAQLWAENCQRCHNTPSPSSFSHEQWTTIGMHMQTRAMITDQERDKIVAFLRQ